jgi:hypothetical protein
MQEVWRPVVGYEGLYEVSDQGRVRSLDRAVVQLNKGGNCVRVYKGRLLRQVETLKGYLTVCLSKEGRHRTVKVHQLVLDAFVGERGPGQVCRHGPQGVGCNALRNLCYGTQRENILDKKRDGTHIVGERHYRARLTEAQVLEILASEKPGRELAKKYGVGDSTVYSIRSGASWTYLHQ